MPKNSTDTTDVLEADIMPKDWMQIRIEKNTAKDLDEVHVERKESYNDIIIRLIQFWRDHPKITEKWMDEQKKKEDE
jgi:hypothetical protein